MIARGPLLAALAAGCAAEPSPWRESRSVLLPRPTDAPSEPTEPGTEPPTDTAEVPEPIPNILLVVADDVGAEQLGAYGLLDDPPPTPRLDRLAAEGVLFERAWANPVCSPTRAQILTGRHAFRTGVGLAVKQGEGTFVLSYDEIVLPEALARGRDGPLAHAAVGKWHLGNPWHDGPLNALLHGFSQFVGSDGNLIVEESEDGLPQSYWDWEKNTNGVVARTDRYATTEVTDDALALMAALPEPWFLYVAYQAAHSPYHVPPQELHGQGEPDTLHGEYRAMVESLDTELGRLLDGLGDRTSRTAVIFVSDNGTPGEVVPPPVDSDRAKKSVYEAGVRVPLIVRWPGVTPEGARTDALVGAIDLYATVLDLAGVPADDPARASGVDSVSLAPYLHDPARPPLREQVYAERFVPAGFGPYSEYQQAVRDATYKLHAYLGGREELYALGDGWLEGEDLLARGPLDPEAEAAWRRLRAALPPIPGGS